MSQLAALLRSTRGAAAAEMALIIPLMLILMMGSFELGNFFMSEHKLVKAVRDGARFAARQSFSNYVSCSGDAGGTVRDDTRNVVMTGLLAGGSARLVNWNASTISVTQRCTTTANSTPLSGIYRGAANGAPIVTVSATVLYTPVLASYGFRGVGLNLNAKQEAAVMGL